MGNWRKPGIKENFNDILINKTWSKNAGFLKKLVKKMIFENIKMNCIYFIKKSFATSHIKINMLLQTSYLNNAQYISC